LNIENYEKDMRLQVFGLRTDTGKARLQSIVGIFGKACKHA